jgi:fucose permease
VGAVLGPLMMTAILTAGRSWRMGCAVVAAIDAGMIVVFATTARWWPRDSTTAPSSSGESAPPASIREAFRSVSVWIQIGLFLLYTGLEVAVATWSFSILTMSRHVSTEAAGAWTSLFWVSLTGGRILLSVFGARVSPDVLLRLAVALTPIGAALLWLDRSVALSFLPLVVLGLAFAPIYPLMISRTAARVGARLASQAVGFQVCAAYLGVAMLPGLAGLIARRWGLESIGPMLVAVSLALVMLNEIAVRRAARQPSPLPQAAIVSTAA